MNLNEYNFNVPEFVRCAAPDCFDPSVSGAVVVGGLRIDNPAAAWVAGAEIRKHASVMEGSVVRMIKQACSLFNIGDSLFTSIEVAPETVISDGVHTANFNIYDNQSLNKAASDLLSRRSGLPYAFAHDCAVALQDEATAQGLTFDADKVVALRKLAGDYNVDFAAGRKLLNEAVKKAESVGMSDHAAVLNKIAYMCTDDCSPAAVPYFIEALDEFNRGLKGLNKSASADRTMPEDVFYVSTREFLQKQASAEVSVCGKKVTAGALRESADNISKWASVCGYSIPSNATPEQIASTVAKMPSAIQEEFVELFV